MKFEEHHSEGVRLTAYPISIPSLGCVLIGHREVAGTEVYDLVCCLSYRPVKDVEFDVTPSYS